MSWHGGSTVVEGINNALESAGMTGDIPMFWSIIYETLDRMDYSDWHNHDIPELQRIVNLRRIMKDVDELKFTVEQSMESWGIVDDFFSDEDMTLLRSIEITS